MGRDECRKVVKGKARGGEEVIIQVSSECRSCRAGTGATNRSLLELGSSVEGLDSCRNVTWTVDEVAGNADKAYPARGRVERDAVARCRQNAEEAEVVGEM